MKEKMVFYILYNHPNHLSKNMSINQTVYNLGDGTFDFVQDDHSRCMFINAFQAITRTETWDFVAKDHKSFMFSTDNEIYRIMDAMESGIYPPGHSGASFGCVMRNMQYLAKHGIDKYKCMFLNEE